MRARPTCFTGSARSPREAARGLTHGEDDARQALARSIQQRFKLKPALPLMGETIEL
jgi:hypothetical protein